MIKEQIVQSAILLAAFKPYEDISLLGGETFHKDAGTILTIHRPQESKEKSLINLSKNFNTKIIFRRK